MHILINTCSYPLTEHMAAWVDHYFNTLHTLSNVQDMEEYKYVKCRGPNLQCRVLPVNHIIRALKEMSRYLKELIAEFEYEPLHKPSTVMINAIMQYMQNISMYNYILTQLRQKHPEDFKKLDLYFTNVSGRPFDQYTKEHFFEIYKGVAPRPLRSAGG